jgi:deazaflavin-dependent oxidoreductase (nitroreductase family)
MWFMNHIWNPIVRFFLRSPLHGMMSKSLILITYRGEKSGKEYTLPVTYLEDGAAIYVMPGMPEKKVWWHNIHRDTPVKLTVRGQVKSAKATRLEPESDLKTVIRVLNLFIQRNPPVSTLFNIRRNEDGRLNQEDLEKAAARIIIIRLQIVK